jgi:hypothetical protein
MNNHGQFSARFSEMSRNSNRIFFLRESNGMPFFADVMNEGAYILVEYDGNLTRGELEEGRSSAQGLLEAYGCRRLLIDFTSMLRRKSTEDIYYYAESFKVCPSGVKIGLAIPKEQEWCAEFIERLASNRGLHLKVFIDHETAKIWLLGGLYTE